MYEITRQHAVDFRAWWIKRKKAHNYNSCTANREIGCLRRLLSVSYQIDGEDRKNPFDRMKLKADKIIRRKTLTSDDIRKGILNPAILNGLNPDFQLLVKLVINTGMRPIEAIGLELSVFI